MGVFDFLKRDAKPVKRRSFKAAQSGRLFSDFIAGLIRIGGLCLHRNYQWQTASLAYVTYL